MLSLGNVDDAVSGPDERRALMSLLKRLRKEFDTVVIDATPVIDAHGLPTGLDLADAVLLVVDQFGASREDTVAASESLRAMAVPNIRGRHEPGRPENRAPPSADVGSRPAFVGR